MTNSLTVGRFLYALALLALGIKMFIVGRFPADLMPMPETVPGGFVLPYLVALMLTLCGLGIATGIQTRIAALLVGAFLLGFGLVIHLPGLLANPTNPGPWTPLFELVALSGGALIIAGQVTPVAAGQSLLRLGKYLFIGALLVFSGLHFIYAQFIATLITAWIPGHLFWAYFVGVAFLATAISLLINRFVSLSTTLLGAMFLLWVLVLHAPRALAKPQSEPEWTSLLIALAMGGISLVISGIAVRESTVVRVY